jgi:two-component system response regulator NreC
VDDLFNKLRILLVDDHALLRSGLRMLFNNQSDMEVVAEAANGMEACSLVALVKPDFIILDISLTGLDGISTLEEIKKIDPQTKILMLTMYRDAGYLKAALEKGADGYLVKSAEENELLNAVRQIREGTKHYDKNLADELLHLVFTSKDDKPNSRHQEGDILTEREKEILKLVALGFADKQIATELVISIKTVENHKSRIREKLKLRRLADMVRYAIQQGYLSDS